MKFVESKFTDHDEAELEALYTSVVGSDCLPVILLINRLDWQASCEGTSAEARQIEAVSD